MATCFWTGFGVVLGAFFGPPGTMKIVIFLWENEHFQENRSLRPGVQIGPPKETQNRAKMGPSWA